MIIRKIELICAVLTYLAFVQALAKLEEKLTAEPQGQNLETFKPKSFIPTDHCCLENVSDTLESYLKADELDISKNEVGVIKDSTEDSSNSEEVNVCGGIFRQEENKTNERHSSEYYSIAAEISSSLDSDFDNDDNYNEYREIEFDDNDFANSEFDNSDFDNSDIDNKDNYNRVLEFLDNDYEEDSLFDDNNVFGFDKNCIYK